VSPRADPILAPIFAILIFHFKSMETSPEPEAQSN